MLALALVLLAASSPNSVVETIAMSKKAAGGQNWNDVRTLHVTSKLEAAGLTGRADSWTDLSTGRFLDRYALGPASGAHGFNGTISWIEDGSGQVRVEDSADARAEASDESYRRSRAMWFPERRAAQVTDGETRDESGRTVRQLFITPAGGRPFEMWLDAKSMLVVRIVEKSATQTQTTRLSDYRPSHGIWLPFAVRLTNGNSRFDQKLSVVNVEVNAAIPDEAFSKPAPPPPPARK